MAFFFFFSLHLAYYIQLLSFGTEEAKLRICFGRNLSFADNISSSGESKVCTDGEIASFDIHIRRCSNAMRYNSISLLNEIHRPPRVSTQLVSIVITAVKFRNPCY
ncbi:hypothetical protein AA313_de0200096 [Arthrobotrys entomopaga]|nr:hypothetical protein AA313_de0200096 [Arthrobotrys entomopaga]